MEIKRRLPHFLHSDIFWQNGIHTTQDRRDVVLGLCSHVRNLAARMHTSIGTTRKDKSPPFLRELLPGFLKRALNGAPIVLPLRANKVSAVVLNSKGYIPHSDLRFITSRPCHGTA